MDLFASLEALGGDSCVVASSLLRLGPSSDESCSLPSGSAGHSSSEGMRARGSVVALSYGCNLCFSLEMGYNAKAYWFVHALVPVNKFFVLLPGGNCVVGYSMEDLSEDLGLCAGQESSIKIREIYAHIVNSTRHPYTFPKRVCYWVIETVGIYIRFWN